VGHWAGTAGPAGGVHRQPDIPVREREAGLGAQPRYQGASNRTALSLKNCWHFVMKMTMIFVL
jgi:hypothetical protein